MNDQEFFLEKIPQSLLELSKIASLQYAYNKRQLVFQIDKVKLFHYQPLVRNPHAVPTLIVYATVNRPEILDLFPEQSFVRNLLDNGVDVYLLDWGYPTIEDKHISLGDYVTHYLNACVNFMCESTRQEKINLLGICQGGLLCLCYSSLFKKVNKLILISAPIDFQTEDNTIYKFTKKMNVDLMVQAVGNISGTWLTHFFISLRPFELIGRKYLRFVDQISEQEKTTKFLHVERWLHDAPDQTGTSFGEFIRDYYQNNKLIKNEIVMNGKQVNLKNVDIPILNIIAQEDEIIPPSASEALERYVGSKNVTQQFYPSGHIGIYISDKVGKSMTNAISAWIKGKGNP